MISQSPLMPLRFGAVQLIKLTDNNGPNARRPFAEVPPEERSLRLRLQLSGEEAEWVGAPVLDLNESIYPQSDEHWNVMDTFRVMTDQKSWNLTDSPQDPDQLEKVLTSVLKALSALPNREMLEGMVDNGFKTPFQMSGYVLKAKFFNSLAIVAERYGFTDLLLKHLDPQVAANIVGQRNPLLVPPQ